MIREQINLKPYNTFGLSVNAKYFAEFSSVDELRTILNQSQDKSLLILGGGSNILFTKDVEGLVLKNNIRGIGIVQERDNNVYVKSYAGEIWHNLVLYAIEKNLAGIENLSLIPGSVGAAPLQNIGAYGVEIKDIFEELEAYEIATGKLRVFKSDECNFGYRESVFKKKLKGQYIIISVTLKLSHNADIKTSYGAIETRLKELKIDTPSIRDVSEAVIYIRKTKLPDPEKIGNSGSFFKNPVVSKEKFNELQNRFPEIPNYPIDENHVKLAAGWLIDNAGWKGKTIGNCGVHKNQALVLVNYGNAKGMDIYKLSEDILASIKQIYGIELEREVNVI